jgi:hypothetical protein
MPSVHPTVLTIFAFIFSENEFTSLAERFDHRALLVADNVPVYPKRGLRIGMPELLPNALQTHFPNKWIHFSEKAYTGVTSQC